ncbi:MAG: TetR/AcrR family transcriptional regulator [Clostridia bacterium]|nr:TetR/AcrR family transcriptional regulator [Clostridia bacterium]
MKKDLKTELTKEKILKAASEEFAMCGYAGASVNSICQKNNISKGLVYHNYKNKEELYLCCLENAVEEFISFMSRINFGSNFKLYMEERYSFFQTHPNDSRLIFSTEPSNKSDLSEKIMAVKSKFDKFNRGIYLTAIENIKLRDGISKEDAFEYYSLLQNMFNSFLAVRKNDNDSFDSYFLNHEKNLERILDFVLYGIAKQE